jgi:hypothetical protein
MNCTVAGGICLVDTFRVQYFLDTDAPQIMDLLVGSAGGDLYREEFRGVMAQVTTNLSLRSDVPLQGVQRGQKLYIADYGLADGDTDGSVADTTLDATGVADWTAIGANIYDYVVVISNSTGTAVDGTYTIDAIVASHITLSESAGTGNCTYRVERAPKVYDPVANTLSLLTADTYDDGSVKGQVPSGCPLIARFRDRIVLGAADYAPHVWYMSRQADPADWDYDPTDLDSQRAVAGTSSPAGVPGEPLTAFSPYSDDYMVMGCTNSLWIMRGDPTYNGELDSLSNTVGIVSGDSWAYGPSGELIFMSRDGVYSLSAGGQSFPSQVSREVMPEEMININSQETTVLMEYDTRDRGVHIYLTPDSSNDRTHWWLDWERKSFWPVSLQSDHEPTALARLVAQASEDTGIILGCRDGWFRRYSDSNFSDGAYAISSNVLFGPIPLGNDYRAGTIKELVGIMASDSESVTFNVMVGDTYEQAVNASAISTGTFGPGLNYTFRPHGRGNSFMIEITSDSAKWALEHILVSRTLVGRNRVK